MPVLLPYSSVSVAGFPEDPPRSGGRTNMDFGPLGLDPFMQTRKGLEGGPSNWRPPAPGTYLWSPRWGMGTQCSVRKADPTTRPVFQGVGLLLTIRRHSVSPPAQCYLSLPYWFKETSRRFSPIGGALCAMRSLAVSSHGKCPFLKFLGMHFSSC